jgi:hypothetical protein
LSCGGGIFVPASGFVGESNCGVSSVGGSVESPKGERNRSLGSPPLVLLLGVLFVPEAAGSCAERNESAASSRLTTMLRVCVSAPVPLVSRGASSSNAVCRTAVSTRVELVCGRVNRKGFPDGAYDDSDEFSDVELDIELFEPDVEVEVDGVEREVASARSLRHFNSEAAFAFEMQTASASKVSVLNRKRDFGPPLWVRDSSLLLVGRELGRVVRRFLRNRDVMGMVLPHTGRGDLDESCFRA